MGRKRIVTIAVFVVSGAIAASVVAYKAAFFAPLGDAVWQPENRILLAEYLAPDSSSKIGVYMYDAGALGYTTLNVSLVGVAEAYPIAANLLKSDKVPASVAWTGPRNVLIRLYPDFGQSQARTEPPANMQMRGVLIQYEVADTTR